MIPDDTRKLGKGKKVVFFLIMLSLPLGLLVLSEFMARAIVDTSIPPTSPASLFVASDNFRLIYELSPRNPDINSFGMRQQEFDRSTLLDQFVVAVIGDSHSYSVKSPDRDKAFPARLEQHLTALTGRAIKVLNFGVPGYDMHQELEVLKVKALPFEPDLVILQYCINDEHISNYIQPKYMWLNHAIHDSVLLTHVWTKFLYSQLGQRYVFSFVEKHLPDLLLVAPGLVGTQTAHGEQDPAHALHPPRSPHQVPPRYHDFIGWEHFERDVRIFGQVAKGAGIPTIATGFIEDRNRNLYETSGFQVYSFFEMFQGRDMRDYGYDPAITWEHFSDSGSDVIGQALASFIAAHVDLSKN